MVDLIKKMVKIIKDTSKEISVACCQEEARWQRASDEADKIKDQDPLSFYKRGNRHE